LGHPELQWPVQYNNVTAIGREEKNQMMFFLQLDQKGKIKNHKKNTNFKKNNGLVIKDKWHLIGGQLRLILGPDLGP